LSCKFTN